jgi:Eukaryotic aspartyl protease
LWLNDLDANTGQILFGGVNTDKYHGSLQTVPILKVAGLYTEFLIALNTISLNGTSIPSPSLPAAVLLDSGTTLMYLPNDVAGYIYNQVRASTDTGSGRVTAYVPCALAREDRNIDFTFSGIKISVPFNELVLSANTPDEPGLEFDDGTPACVFGIAPSGGGTSVLGDTFLRSAYVVYDLANNQISLAQTNFNSTTDRIQEIEVGATGVPDAITVPNPITTARGVGRGAARLEAAAAMPTGSVTSGSPEQAKMLQTFSLMSALLAAIGSAA